jgi:hypothetical protein
VDFSDLSGKGHAGDADAEVRDQEQGRSWAPVAHAYKFYLLRRQIRRITV